MYDDDGSDRGASCVLSFPIVQCVLILDKISPEHFASRMVFWSSRCARNLLLLLMWSRGLLFWKFVVTALPHHRHQVADSLSLTTMMMSRSSSRPSSRFITNKMCPFAQKAWIALEAANANYQLEQVSLYGPGGKPDWFWKLNPKGQVPVLVVATADDDDHTADVVLTDSDLILDEIGRRVLLKSESKLVVPEDVATQVNHKIQAFRRCLREFLPIGKNAVLGGDKKKMWTKLQELDALIEGPFVVGDQLTIADCAGFPFLWRIDQEYANGWDDHGCNNVPRWLEHCSRQPAFAKTIQRSWWWWW